MIFHIEANEPISPGSKIPHLCPAHDDRNPSAVTFFHDNNKCFTFCSACHYRGWGRYEVSGGIVTITIAPTSHSRKRGNTPAPVARSLGTQGEQSDEEKRAKAMWYHLISRSVPPKGEPDPIVKDFWIKYLGAKGVTEDSLSKVENPPVIFRFGLWFPLSVVEPTGLVIPVPDYGVVRSIPYKSLNFFPRDMSGAGTYIPCPSLLRFPNTVIVVESPVVALRLSKMGYPSAAALGTGNRVAKYLRVRHRVVVIRDPGEQVVEADWVVDLDRLSDNDIARFMTSQVFLFNKEGEHAYPNSCTRTD